MKKWLIAGLFTCTLMLTYVELVNRNGKNMTTKQKLMKAFYPLISFFGNIRGGENQLVKNEKIMPTQSLYNLPLELNNGQTVPLEQFKGKKLLLVNTASNCGLTGQYEELQELHKKYQGKLIVIGFPANDFKEQEKGSNEEIAQFCKINYGVEFPLAAKSTVIKKAGQNKIFDWLTDESKNGWNNQQPTWNFAKYLIDENGNLRYYFEPTLSPLSSQVISAIEEK
jgi:glutathione peroxidase